MAKFHPLHVKEVRKETEDTVSVAFDVPANLENDYKFKQGQYVTLKTNINGEEVRRSYSICVSPLDQELRVAVKMVPGGKFSTYANKDLKAGDVLDVMNPMGNFTSEVMPGQRKKYVLFAAGSGITPIMSILKTVLQTEEESEVVLLYGNKKSSTIIFQEQIEDLKNVYMNRLSVYYVLSQEHPGAELFYGRIDAERCNDFASCLFDPKTVDEVFICGPEPMINAVSESLEAKGVDKSKVHFELFGTPVVGEQLKATATVVDSEASVEDADVTVVLDAERSSFKLSTKGDTILDAAMDAGMDVPFACKGAVCMTCRAKCLEGGASMEKNYALTDDEVKQGYILTCQAHPTSKKLVVSFDD